MSLVLLRIVRFSFEFSRGTSKSKQTETLCDKRKVLPVYEKRYIPSPGSSKGAGRLLGNEEFKKGMVSPWIQRR